MHDQHHTPPPHTLSRGAETRAARAAATVTFAHDGQRAGDHDEELQRVRVNDGSQAAQHRGYHRHQQYADDGPPERPAQSLLDEHCTRVQVHLRTAGQSTEPPRTEPPGDSQPPGKTAGHSLVTGASAGKRRVIAPVRSIAKYERK